MKPVRLWFGSGLAALAVTAAAQTVIHSGPLGNADPERSVAALPLRNLQIEVRQIEQDKLTRERLDATLAARLQPGQSAAAIDIQAQTQQSNRSGTARQQVLVLNGRRTAIHLGQTVALRVLRTIWHNGVWRTVPATLWLQAGSGLEALPRWDGGNMVELELSARQSRPAAAGSGVDATATASTLMLPLGEWMTIAQSEQELDQQQSGLSSQGRTSSQARLEVQVRVSLR